MSRNYLRLEVAMLKLKSRATELYRAIESLLDTGVIIDDDPEYIDTLIKYAIELSACEEAYGSCNKCSVKSNLPVF